MEMIVNMDCHGCERKVRKALQDIDGVESVDIDMKLQKVTVNGWVDQDMVLETVRSTGNKAELWPFRYNPRPMDMYNYSDPTTYFHVNQPDISTYNYNYNYENRHNGYGHVTYDQDFAYSSTRIGENPSMAFNDENVNACSIM